MFLIDRVRCGTEDCPEEEFEIAGTTGNIYSVHIGRQPSCNCPHALKGNQCKHVIYVSRDRFHYVSTSWRWRRMLFSKQYYFALDRLIYCFIFVLKPVTLLMDNSVDPCQRPQST